MERKQFISNLVLGGSGVLISTTFLYACLKTGNGNDHTQPTRKGPPVKTGDIFLLADNIHLVQDQAFAQRFRCTQVATATLLSIIRKAPFPFSRQHVERSKARSHEREHNKRFSTSYHYSTDGSCEYSITDVSNFRTTIKVPLFSGNEASGYPVIRLLAQHELDKWFDATLINKIANT